MRASTVIALALLASSVGACTQSAPSAQVQARACTPPRAHWQRQHNFEGLMPLIIRVSLDRGGTVYWEGRVSSLHQVYGYFDVARTMSPQPLIFLDTEMGAPCAALESLRDEMDRRLQCNPHGMCAEGIWAVWRATPTPPGTPPS
jgi:hypothetical protein